MRALNRKILRDLGHLKGQAAAIALVIASGVMTLVIAVTSLDALTITKERFYSEYQFADVFAEITRAPESAVERFRDAPGIKKWSEPSLSRPLFGRLPHLLRTGTCRRRWSRVLWAIGRALCGFAC